jgi:hypothetical protein
MQRRTEGAGIKIGFSIGVSDDEPPEETFLESVRFAEWLHRERWRAPKSALRNRLQALFEALPGEARVLITDDENALIRDIVRTRNVLVHALEGREGRRASGERLETIIIKLGILLSFHFGMLDHGVDVAKEVVPGIRKNGNLMKHLSQSDRVDDRQGHLPGF